MAAIGERMAPLRIVRPYRHFTHRMCTAMSEMVSEEKRRFHLHLVSDATGETINSVARACVVQFDGIDPTEHVWTLIRTPGQMEKVLGAIAAHPGIVLFTIVNDELRTQLREGCRKLQT